MNIFFISSAVTINALKKLSDTYLDGAPLRSPQQTFDYAIAEGLSCQDCKLTLLSLPPLPSYPATKNIFFRMNKDFIRDNFEINYIPVINVFIVKTFCIFFGSLKKIVFWYLKNRKKNNFIVIHWIYFPTMLVAYLMKLVFNCKIILIVPDIPLECYKYSKFSYKKLLGKLLTRFRPKLEFIFDGYVFLTKDMNSLLNTKKVPFKIIEGIVSVGDFIKFKNFKHKKKKKVVMYAGAVYQKFGLDKLIKSFHEHVYSESELWIFGDGDYVDTVKKYSRVDKRIKYKGLKFREEILEAECEASLLINVRSSSEKYTRYSFPSKTLEYMASGTPFASTRLPGIPEDYDKYIIWLDDESVEGIGKKINFILGKDPQWLYRFGYSSKKWVEENKNSRVQAKKILDLCFEIQNTK